MTAIPLRLLAAGAAAGEAAVHVPLVREHLEEAPWAGIGFILLTIAGFGLAVLLLADVRWAWPAAALVGAVAVVAYLLSRSVGLPQLEDDIGAWRDPLGTAAVALETMMVVAGILGQRSGARRTRTQHRSRPGSSSAQVAVQPSPSSTPLT